VIDFGCADGYFIPSLSNYFPHVVAIDKNKDAIYGAQEVVNKLNANNVDLICNEGLTIKDIKQKLCRPYSIIYILEVLEHVGENPKDMYVQKVEFLRESISELISHQGMVIISVPKTVGLSFLLSRMLVHVLGLQGGDKYSFKEIIRAGVFCDTSDLERHWCGEHKGFNHKKFERYVKESSYENNFEIKKINTPFHMIYILNVKKKKSKGC
jgi:2-polyprenyl-3-methyl-5-hydroxy-6-metoxy-1,4-benzoquinol methylase